MTGKVRSLCNQCVTKSVRPGRLQRLAARFDSHHEARKRLDGAGHVVQPGVGVAVHGQGDRAVPRQGLRLLRLHAGLDQPGDKRVAQGVEVGHPAALVPVGKERGLNPPLAFGLVVACLLYPMRASRFQVGAEHLPSPVVVGPVAGPDRLSGGVISQPSPQPTDDIRMQGEHVLAPVFAVGGVDGQGWRRFVEGEGL